MDGKYKLEIQEAKDVLGPPKIAIVGAGLAGLCCAERLVRSGAAVTVFEKSIAVGGRMRTDYVDGFNLDHGAHAIFLRYPEVSRTVDTQKLSW